MNSDFTLLITSEKGTCVFTNKAFTPNEVLGDFLQNKPSKYGFKVIGVEGLWESNLLGRFCNHSAKPNSYLVKTETGYLLHALGNIEIGDEVTVNYCAINIELGLPVESKVYPFFIRKDYKKFGKEICEY